MKKRDLFYLVNEIDDKLIEEAMEEAKAETKAKSRRIWASVLSAAAVFALVISLSALNGGFTLTPVVNTTEKSTEEVTTQSTEKTTAASDVTEETTKEKEITTEKPTAEKTTLPKTEATLNTTSKNTTEPSTGKPIAPVTTEKVSSQGSASYSLEYWKNAPDVVWGEDAVKGARNSEIVPLGTAKITELLRELMSSGDEKAVYAVSVGFSSCAEKEFENWEFDGTTFSEMKKGYNKAEMTDEEIANYKTKVWEMKYTFCNQKIDSFKDTFSRAGLEIHVVERDVTNCFFYVFGTKKQIESISPKSNEAFVLYPAEQMK